MDESIRAYGKKDSSIESESPGRRDRVKEYLRLLVESSTDVMLVVDGTGTVLFAGGGGLKDLGYKPADVVGKTALELIHPDDVAEQVQVAGQALAESGLAARSEARIQHCNGSWITCEVMSRV